MSVTVRVVAKVRCDAGCVEEKLFDIVDGTPYSRFLDADTRQFCGVCHGTGTVEREVTCESCKLFTTDNPESGVGSCMRNVRREFDDHACKAWEPRE